LHLSLFAISFITNYILSDAFKVSKEPSDCIENISDRGMACRKVKNNTKKGVIYSRQMAHFSKIERVQYNNPFPHGSYDIVPFGGLMLVAAFKKSVFWQWPLSGDNRNI
jgi:hypothetical protein